MPMKVEAAIVTQKRPEASFNTDSVNINGKVFPREVIKNGYKGSGVLSGNVYFALTSSNIEGFADASVAAFNERADIFPVVRDARTVFSGFYEDCRSALLNMERDENELVCTCFYGSGRKTVLSVNGGAKLYVNSAGVTSAVSPGKVVDTVADYESSIFPDVSVGDIFILLSPGAADVISCKEIEDICRISDGSVKRIINYISKVGLAKEGTMAVSAIAVKILEIAPEEELAATGFVADFSEVDKEEKEESVEKAIDEASEEEKNDALAEEKDDAADTSEGAVDELTENAAQAIASKLAEKISEEMLSDSVSSVEVLPEKADNETENLTGADENSEVADASEETEINENDEAVVDENCEAVVSLPDEVSGESEIKLSEEEKKAKAYKRTRAMLFSILGVLIAISIALIGVIVYESGIVSKLFEATTASEETTLEETTEEETSQEATTEETTTEEETTEEEAATAEEETTKKAQNAVAPVKPQSSTTKPRPSETTTKAKEETTQPESSLTENATEETTATVEDNTSAVQEAASETTTSADETEASAGETEAPADDNTAADAPENTENLSSENAE